MTSAYIVYTAAGSVQDQAMRALVDMLAALALLLRQFAEAGGGALIVDLIKAVTDEKRSQSRLADQKRIAEALHAGDLDLVEHDVHKLLDAADSATSDRRETGDQH